jgi:hypothetical protein
MVDVAGVNGAEESMPSSFLRSEILQVSSKGTPVTGSVLNAFTKLNDGLKNPQQVAGPPVGKFNTSPALPFSPFDPSLT